MRQPGEHQGGGLTIDQFLDQPIPPKKPKVVDWVTMYEQALSRMAESMRRTMAVSMYGDGTSNDNSR